MFTVGHRTNARRVLVLIGDGMSDDRNATWFEAMRTRNSGIDIFTVRNKLLFTHELLRVSG